MDTVFDAHAVLFDLDGVLTPTAELHMRAWAALFSGHFAATAAAGHDVGAPYADADYFAYVDGKPRLDGVRSLLESRGLPAGDGLVAALGERKNVEFLALLDSGLDPYPGSVAFLDAVTAAGIAVAVVSSSRNAPRVLAAAGLAPRFSVVVDGALAAAAGLPGKPAPDTYLHAAALLGVEPWDCVVVEDATSGVAAGAAGGFGMVVGVDRGVGRNALISNGADIVVSDLQELV